MCQLLLGQHAVYDVRNVWLGMDHDSDNVAVSSACWPRLQTFVLFYFTAAEVMLFCLCVS